MATEKTAVATQQQATALDMAIDNKFIDGLTTQLTQKEQLGLCFPPNYSVSNSLNSAYLILQETKDRDSKPVLTSCSKQSIASSLMDMTIQGLNPMKKQCYFVAMGGKLKLMRSYQGTMAVAKRCGVVAVNAEVIYEGDTFKYHIENGVKVIDEHIQDFMNIDTAKIKGAYAVLELDDDTQYTEVMNINQIKKAWSKGYGYKDGAGVHGDFGDQMAKKTVIGRACKNIINSSDDANLTDAFNNASDNEELNVVAEDVHYEIETHANSVEFTQPEPIKAEVVEKVGNKPEPEKSVFDQEGKDENN
jgi:recombination protein RecT